MRPDEPNEIRDHFTGESRSPTKLSLARGYAVQALGTLSWLLTLAIRLSVVAILWGTGWLLRLSDTLGAFIGNLVRRGKGR